MQKTPAQLFKRWGEEKGADKYAKATKPVSDSATTLQHYCCCCLSYMGSLSISLSLFLSTWLALQNNNNNNNNVSSSSNSATLQMKRKFTNSIHEILLRWPTSTLTPPSLWSSAPPSCWSSTSMQSHTQRRRQKRVRAREREREESREELYELFVLQLVFVRRVAARLLSAKPRSRRLHVGSALLWCRCLCVALAQLWHLPDVLLLLWNVLYAGSRSLSLPLFCFTQQNPWKMSKEGYCASCNNLRLWSA